MIRKQNIGMVALWMMGTLVSFCGLALSIRSLARIGLMDVLAVRAVVASLMMLAIAAVKPELWQQLRPRKMAAQTLRSGVHLFAQYCWGIGIVVLPLATVFALEFTNPIWVSLLAPVFLGERLTSSRIVAALLGFLGVLIVLRPGFEIVQSASLFVLLAALCFAAFSMITKKLTSTEPTFAIVFWMNLLQFPMALIASVLTEGANWHLPDLGMADIPAIFALGVSGLSAHFCLTNAFQNGDASVVLPFDFLRIPLIAVIDWLFYGKALDFLVFVGAAVIVAGVLWNIRMESKYRPPEPEPRPGAA